MTGTYIQSRPPTVFRKELARFAAVGGSSSLLPVVMDSRIDIDCLATNPTEVQANPQSAVIQTNRSLGLHHADDR